MKNKILLSLVLSMLAIGVVTILGSFNMKPADTKGKLVQWYSFEEAVALSEKKPKKIFIDVYTDWCGWCKKMDAATFEHPEIAKYLNDNYYPVKLDAEQKGDIVFKDHTFKWQPSGRNGIHELAYSLLSGKMSYPTVVFMDEELRILSPVPGYLEVSVFDQIMRYYGEDIYKTTPWKEYQADYKASF